MRIILRTIAVVTFLTGYFYIFGGTTREKNPANDAGSRPRPKDHGNAQSRRGNLAALFMLITQVMNFELRGNA